MSCNLSLLAAAGCSVLSKAVHLNAEIESLKLPFGQSSFRIVPILLGVPWSSFCAWYTPSAVATEAARRSSLATLLASPYTVCTEFSRKRLCIAFRYSWHTRAHEGHWCLLAAGVYYYLLGKMSQNVMWETCCCTGHDAGTARSLWRH